MFMISKTRGIFSLKTSRLLKEAFTLGGVKIYALRKYYCSIQWTRDELITAGPTRQREQNWLRLSQVDMQKNINTVPRAVFLNTHPREQGVY